MTATPEPAAKPAKLRRASKPRLMMRVVKGGISPADAYTTSLLRERNYTVGDIVAITISKCRNPNFNNLVHRIGALCAANIDAFSGQSAHAVLKRLQIEADIGCEHIMLKFPGIGMVEQRIPMSLSFDRMDEGEFRVIARDFCRHIAEHYWPDLSPEKVEEMAESFVEE